jgi:LmbE family N-acetylglucosaminyl deacetylase
MPQPDPGPFTLVAFHAHPDDETLLTGGTLAQVASDGHRVVLVTATDGARGLAGPGDGTGVELARRRTAELERAADLLGVHRVVALGYGDSGLHPDPQDRHAFANTELDEAADLLAALLAEEDADVLLVYDRNGGYGHPDHVQVHRVGTLAARRAGTPVVLEATVPAGLFRAALRVMRIVGHALGSPPPLGGSRLFTDGRLLTHKVRVRDQLPAKRAAMAAHASQRRAAGRPRVLDLLLRLPLPVFGLALGHEWYVEQGRPPGRRETDVFATLRVPRQVSQT